MSPPSAWTAGDSQQWSGTFDGYSSDDGWEAFWVVRTTDGISHEVDSSGAAETFTVILGADATADMTPGLAEWFVFVRKGTERVTLGKGVTRVYPDPQRAYDDTYARRQLRNVEAAIDARLRNDTSERYTVGGQSHDKIPLSELTASRNYWLVEVAKEVNRARRLATGRKQRRVVRTAFTR